MLAGDPDEARSKFQDALVLQRRVGEPRAVAAPLVARGVVVASVDPTRARVRHGEARDIYRELDDRYWLTQTGLGTAVVERLDGDPGAARRTLGAELDPVLAAHDVTGLAQLLHQLATLDDEAGRWERALALAAATERLRDEDGAGTPPARFARPADVLADAAAHLPADAIDRAWAAGWAMDQDAVVSLAREAASDVAPAGAG
jgi:hypothetical protein